MQSFRGQYYLGPSAGAAPEGFVETDTDTAGVLLTHCSLPRAVVSEGHDRTILLGFCVDHRHPGDDLEAIATRLHSVPVGAVVAATGSLVGRWVLVRQSGEIRSAMNDAGGTFPICHLRIGGRTAIASSSRLLERMHPGRPANPTVSDRFRSLQATPGLDAGRAFPLTLTSYADVHALLPNHALDVVTGTVSRHFPTAKVYGDATARQAAPEIAALLVRIIAATAARFDLRFAATGGFDSRLLQGAIANVEGLAQRTEFFTFRYAHGEGEAHRDITDARKVASAIGARHRVFDATSDGASDETVRCCRASEEFHATGFEGWNDALSGTGEPGDLILMGWASEIARGFYRWAGSRDATTQDLMRCAGVEGEAAMEPAFDRWREEAMRVQAETGIHLMDLFYWENRVALWCGSGLNVLNTAHDWMTPFSCLDLLTAMLRVREKDRVGRRQALYREIASVLLPDLTDLLPNAMSLPEKVRYAVRFELRERLRAIALALGIRRRRR